ncbi:MAG: nucleotidyl transferase AbiEii/AbiGii toxin family protein, partial [Cytophagaceae bacterium]|nr:nucleotidyl transferase AbiEii/AbiGii toxin family protein [Cytophagaceae bacterium]
TRQHCVCKILNNFMEELLRYVCTELEKRNIAYMLSGSMALALYVPSRTTRDIDLVIELTEEQVDDLAEIFAGDYYFHRPSVEIEVRRRGMFNVLDGRSGGKIDFMVRNNTEYRRMEFSRRQRAEVWNTECWIVAPEDLILSKLIWIQELFSEVQARDIRNMLENCQELDWEYIKSWIKKLNLNTYSLL